MLVQLALSKTFFTVFSVNDVREIGLKELECLHALEVCPKAILPFTSVHKFIFRPILSNARKIPSNLSDFISYSYNLTQFSFFLPLSTTGISDRMVLPSAVVEEMTFEK